MEKPRFETGEARLLAGLSGHYGPATLTQIPALWMRWGPAWFGKTPGQVGKKTYGACYNADGKGNFDYLAGVEVASFDGLPAELTQLSLLAQRYAVFAHQSHISQIGMLWMHIYDQWLPASGHKHADAADFELYDEKFDPMIGIGHVEIWIPLQ